MQSRPNETLTGMKNHSTITEINIVNSRYVFFKIITPENKNLKTCCFTDNEKERSPVAALYLVSLNSFESVCACVFGKMGGGLSLQNAVCCSGS